MKAILERVRHGLQSSIEAKEAILKRTEMLESISVMVEEMIKIYARGGKLLIAGNGGSAADAQHFAAEITCQYMQRRQGRPALALHTDTSALTAWANDHSFDSVFGRLVQAHGKPGDGLVVISTSGNSKNLVYAAERARSMDMVTFGLLGKEGGALAASKLCDHAIIVRSGDTPRIQECHITLIHILCEELDRFFYKQDHSASKS